jgi:hypothetical protein
LMSRELENIFLVDKMDIMRLTPIRLAIWKRRMLSMSHDLRELVSWSSWCNGQEKREVVGGGGGERTYETTQVSESEVH